VAPVALYGAVQTGHWIQCHGVLGRSGGGLSGDAQATLLDVQDNEFIGLSAKTHIGESQTGPARYLAGG